MYIQQELKQLIAAALEALNLSYDSAAIPLERPTQSTHGEYASPIALTIYGKEKKENSEFGFKNPRELADAISAKLLELTENKTSSQSIKSVSVAGPGFINFTLSDQYYLGVAETIGASQEGVYMPSKPAGSIIIEYVSPNTNKPLHIGHVRNAALGSAMGRILEKVGWEVHLGIINNDRGLHITKSMWAYLLFGQKEYYQQTADQSLTATQAAAAQPWQEVLSAWILDNSTWLTPQDMLSAQLQKPDHFVGYWYKKGDTFAEDVSVQKVWSEMLQAWEGKDLPYHAEVRQLWQYLNNLFYQGFNQTAAIIGATFEPDNTSYESQLYEAGKAVIIQGAAEGKFTRLEDGAVKAKLDQFNLPDKVMIRKDGTGLYILQDIELLKQRIAKNPDKIVYVVGMDQQLYFQQLFAVAQLLGYGNQEKFYHFAYGMVRLPEGKMSSRKGRVVYADDLFELALEKAKEIMQQVGVAKELPSDEFATVAQAVGVGAVKWTMLAQDASSEITFNIEESVSFTGFAGPYIQYTVARTHSIFKKAENRGLAISFDAQKSISSDIDTLVDESERAVVVALSKYFDVVERAAQEFAPHLLAPYLHELAQCFSSFYAHHTIVGQNETESQRRLLITKAVQRILIEGLQVLGITPVERM